MSFQGRWGGNWSGDWLGAEAAPSSTTGTRSLLAFWIGGAGSLGGASASTGYVGLLAPWMGGAGYGGGTPPAPEVSEWIIRARRRGRR